MSILLLSARGLLTGDGVPRAEAGPNHCGEQIPLGGTQRAQWTFSMPMEHTTLPPGASDPGVVLAATPSRCRRRAPNRRELFRIFLVLLALTFVLRLPAFFTPVFNSDETFLATQAHVLNDGGAALRGGDRPEAADRALRVRGDVRVLRDHRAVVGTHRGDARGRAHRAAPRDRGSTALRRARRMDRRDPVRRRDGVVRAPGRPGRQLRGVHAAVDDGGDPLRTRAGAASSRASPSPPPPWPSRRVRRRSSR